MKLKMSMMKVVHEMQYSNMKAVLREIKLILGLEL